MQKSHFRRRAFAFPVDEMANKIVIKVACACSQQQLITSIEQNKTFIDVHKDNFNNNNALKSVNVFCRGTTDWTAVNEALWLLPLSSMYPDFPITQIKYSCDIQQPEPTQQKQKSVFDILMGAQTQSFLPEKRIRRLVLIVVADMISRQRCH